MRQTIKTKGKNNFTMFKNVPVLKEIIKNNKKSEQEKKRNTIFNLEGNLRKAKRKSVSMGGSLVQDTEQAEESSKMNMRVNFLAGKNIKNWSIDCKSEIKTIYKGKLSKMVMVSNFENPGPLDRSDLNSSNYYDIDKTGKMYRVRPEDRMFRRDYIRANRKLRVLKDLGEDTIKALKPEENRSFSSKKKISKSKTSCSKMNQVMKPKKLRKFKSTQVRKYIFD